MNNFRLAAQQSVILVSNSPKKVIGLLPEEINLVILQKLNTFAAEFHHQRFPHKVILLNNDL